MQNKILIRKELFNIINFENKSDFLDGYITCLYKNDLISKKRRDRYNNLIEKIKKEKVVINRFEQNF